MIASAALHLVDGDTGEVIPGCPHCQELKDELSGAMRDLRAWRARYAALVRDKEAEAESSQHWPEALKAFEYWRSECKHPRSDWCADRFDLVVPFLKKDGMPFVLRAIDGASFDPFTTERKNGTKKRHDDWGLIFRDRDHFESFVNRAPIIAVAS